MAAACILLRVQETGELVLFRIALLEHHRQGHSEVCCQRNRSFAIAMKDGRPFTFAGLWEDWKNPESERVSAHLHDYHTEPNGLVAQIYPCMPVIVHERHHAVWLGETDDGKPKSVVATLSG